ncbi:MAG: histidine phosphatase family protein [Collinsella aerofaciens]
MLSIACRWCDSPLTARARAGCTVGSILKSGASHFDHAYCSTSERASDTLELMTSMPYTRLRGLKEMNFGKLEGLQTSVPKRPRSA